MSKVPEDRRNFILNELREHGFMSVTALAKKLYVSLPTIRRDLTALEKEGVLIRTHGGASYLNEPSVPPSYEARRGEHIKEKYTIGRLAAKLITNGGCVFIESSTTCQMILHALKSDIKLKVLTNGIRTAYRLGEFKNIQVELCCGIYDYKHENCYGDDACNFIKKRHADLCFLSCNGMDGRGLSSRNQRDVALKRAMSDNAAKTVLLMDSSKCSQTFYYHVFDWSDIDIIISDKRPLEEVEDACDRSGVRVIVPKLVDV